MHKHTEKTAQTKADLVAAFWQLYKEKPINKITVKEVTDTAGYYRSTMYYYFEDVYAILEYIEASVVQDWEENLSSVLIDKHLMHLSYDVQSTIDLIMPFYLKNGEYIAVLLSPNGDPLFGQKFKSALQKKLFSKLEIPDDTLEAELLFECICSGILAMFIKWYNDKLPTELVVEIIQKVLDKNIMSLVLSYSQNPIFRQFAV